MTTNNIENDISASFDEKMHHLKACLGMLAPYPHHSRIHPLKTFAYSNADCFVKREDELGFGISGSKMRKYLSLIPYLQQENIETALLIGGAHSNNIVGLTQLLIENSIQPVLFLRGNKESPKIGNLLLITMMIPEESIYWISRDDWSTIYETVENYKKNQLKKTIIVPEGANMPESLPGSLTLALDILNNEQKSDVSFDHIFIDSGTGMMACSVLLAFTWLKKKITIHIILMAEGEIEFLETLSVLKLQFEVLLSIQLEWLDIMERMKFHFPNEGRSFGSTNKRIFDEIRHLSQTEGFLTDPIYSVKLFLKARTVIDHDKVKGNCLLIHSGGGLSLMGFQSQLARVPGVR